MYALTLLEILLPKENITEKAPITNCQYANRRVEKDEKSKSHANEGFSFVFRMEET
jgi:hypothetical protein